MIPKVKRERNRKGKTMESYTKKARLIKHLSNLLCKCLLLASVITMLRIN